MKTFNFNFVCFNLENYLNINLVYEGLSLSGKYKRFLGTGYFVCSYLLEHENNMICENARLIFIRKWLTKIKVIIHYCLFLRFWISMATVFCCVFHD